MNCKTIVLIYLLCHLLLLVSCSKSEQTTELLKQADSIVSTNTDSADCILDKIRDINCLSDRQRADYWRVRTTLHVLQGKSTIEDSTIIVALDYYKKHNMLEELKETYKLVLNHLSWSNDTTNYPIYLEEAKQLAKQENDSLFTYIILRTVANDFYSKKDYLSAYHNYLKASEYNGSYPSVFYMAALSFSRIKNNDTIDYYMQKAINLSKYKNDTASIRHYYRNYADIQIGFKEYDKALANIRNMEQYNIGTFTVAPYMIAEIFIQQHQLDSAQLYIKKMLDQDFGKENKKSFIFTRQGLAFLQNIVDYTKGGSFDFGLIGQYSDSLLFDQDKRMKKFEEQLFVKQKLSEQNQELTIEKQRIQLLLLGLILVILLITFLTYLYIRRKKEKIYQMKEKMESIQELLADVSIDLKESRENNTYFKKVLLQQLGLIRQTASNPTSQNQEMLQRMAKITNEEIPVDSLIVWNDLYALIDSLYDNFYTKMNYSFGSIFSEKEIQLCCLLCADFSTKEISVITQQSIRTIYQRKTIVREKLDMPQGEDIVEFIRYNTRY
ncbi:MAG: hypothetical protein PHG27_10170 [Massilibacteroides sp.]|nr:hypothetical protein [Massilibacteroides sp.]MDD3062415.1 hypothetical protein [Massilibacteroides sp.]MDD4115938.1 hypothetical protein [Massilibacteroides sp.]MDD4660715.1 hypothetical protein [Massilibacteroides sp.]